MIDVKVERLSDFIEDFARLNVLHYNEIEGNKEIKELSPNYESYLNLDNAGVLLSVTARDGDNLVGYCVNVIMPHLHYSKTTFSTNDTLYLLQEYRGRFIGKRMIAKAMECSKELGAEVFHIEDKDGHGLGRLFNVLGMMPSGTTYEVIL